MYDNALEDLPLPAHFVEAGDTNGDGLLSNIEFYEVTDPLNGDGMFYIYDHFNWDHCGRDDVQGQDAATNGLADVDGVPMPNGAASGSDSMTFYGGVDPTVWGGDSYDQMKPSGVTPNPATMEEHRAAVASGALPGKSLKKNVRLPGSKADFEAVMDLLA